MLTIEKENDETFLLKIDGQINSEEMEIGLNDLISRTEGLKGGKLLYDIRHFQMPSFGALMVEIRKIPRLFSLIGRFDKAAVLAEEPWLRAMAEWEGMLIPGFEIKSFPHKDEREARAWLEV